MKLVSDRYLENLVLAASPAELRLLLINRACDLCGRLHSGEAPLAVAGESLALRDVLGELLNGVKGDGESQLCRQVADLYVFLIQHLTRAELQNDRDKIFEIQNVLEVERDTWTQVVSERVSRKPVVAPRTSSSLSMGLSVEA